MPPQPAAASAKPKLASFALTHRGRVRATNEDCILARPDIGLWAVADGMGGHRFGEIASGMVVEALSAVAEVHSPYAYLGAVREALLRVNRQLVARADAGATGSTVVALLAAEGHFAVLWAGDSRAYQWRDGALLQLTRDHSVVQDLVDAGALRSDEAKSHRQSHVITRAVGASADLLLDMRNGPILAGDRYLLCSDGLTTHLSDEEIEAVLGERDLELTATRLRELALGRGGSDNISIIVIDASQDAGHPPARPPAATDFGSSPLA